MTDTTLIVQRSARLADPHDCTDAKDALTILQAVFDTLITRMAGRFAPALATSWTVSPDARFWRFHLREGVAFHDGTPCDAAAVVSSLRRMARPDKGYTLGAPGVWHQYLGGARIAAEGPLTVAVDLDQPVADLLDILVQGFIVAPSSLARLDAGKVDHPDAWGGTGPYRVVRIAAGEVLAKRTGRHFEARPPNAAICWRAEASAMERFEMLRSGAAQVAAGLDPDASPGPRATRCVSLDPVAIIYLLNAATGPLADARLRRALSLAVDRPALIAEVMGGMAEPLNGFVSRVHFGADSHPAPHDPDRARALLAEAGYRAGLTLRVDCPTSLPDEAVALTAALGRQLAAVGIGLDVTRHEDREGYAHMVRRKEIGDMCVFDSSPMSTFRVLYEKIDSRVAGAWWQGYRNPAVEALLDRARAETDAGVREGTYREIYRLLQDDPPWLTLYNPMRVTGLKGDHPGFGMPVDGVLDVRSLPRFS